MVVRFQEDCVELITNINKEVKRLKRYAHEKERWPVDGMDNLIELLSVLRGTNLDGARRQGYEHPETREGTRWVCYEDAIESLRRAADGTEIASPLDEMQTVLEMELYSEGGSRTDIDEKRTKQVSRLDIDATWGEMESYWMQTLDGLYEWYGVNLYLDYWRPYRQAVR